MSPRKAFWFSGSFKGFFHKSVSGRFFLLKSSLICLLRILFYMWISVKLLCSSIYLSKNAIRITCNQKFKCFWNKSAILKWFSQPNSVYLFILLIFVTLYLVFLVLRVFFCVKFQFHIKTGGWKPMAAARAWRSSPALHAPWLRILHTWQEDWV